MRVALLLLLAAALAGCGDKVAFPEDYLLDVDDAPDGLLLLKPGMPGWDDYADATGATSNPGPVDPALVAQVLGTAEPERADAAVYVTFEGAYLISAAIDLGAGAGIKDWLRDEVTGACLEGSRLFLDGNRMAAILGIGIDHDVVDAAAAAVAKSSKADDLCSQAMDHALTGARELNPGSNGPLEGGWYRFAIPSGTSLDVTAEGQGFDIWIVYEGQVVLQGHGGTVGTKVEAAGTYGIYLVGSDVTVTLAAS